MKHFIALCLSTLAPMSAMCAPVYLQCKLEFARESNFICEYDKRFCEEVIILDEKEKSIKPSGNLLPDGSYSAIKIEKWDDLNIEYSSNTSTRFAEDQSIIYTSESVTQINRITGDIRTSSRYKRGGTQIMSEREVSEMRAKIWRSPLDGMPFLVRQGTCKVVKKLI